MGSLKDFVEAYISNKKIEDYESWLSLYGKDAEASYASSLQNAERTYARGQATYGSKAAGLLDKGLTGSGYGAYLDGKAYERYATSRENATQRRQKDEEENRIRYASYRTEKEEAARGEGESLYKSALSALLSSGISDEKSGAAYLSALGITGDSASELAKINQSVKSSKYREEVFKHCLENYYTREQTLAYATALGLTAEDAETVATAIEKVTSRYPNYGR